MELTSLSLLDRLQHEPRQDDWSRLVTLYQPFIERYIRLDARLAADGEDICQEVLRKVIQHLPRFRRQRDGSFRAWLRTITVNEVNQYWRQRMRAREVDLDEAGFPLAGLQDPDNALSRQWDREHADFLLQRLQELVEPEFSSTTWRAFRLRVFEQQPTAAVAAALGISANAVDIAKSRVLARLRAEAAGLLDA